MKPKHSYLILFPLMLSIQSCSNGEKAMNAAESCQTAKDNLAIIKARKEYPYYPNTDIGGRKQHEEDIQLNREYRANIISGEELVSFYCNNNRTSF